jgi:O-antigen/teichoic acid export membrane protein
VASLGIKVGAAGLTYLMYIALSRTMGETAYGEFTLGLSLAIVLAVVAGLGQQTSILRFWPEENAQKRPVEAHRALRAGSALTIFGGVGITIVALGIIGLAGVSGGSIGSLGYLAAGAVAILPMAFAEYSSSALRAQGSVWIALLPRDVLWRLGVCGAAAVFLTTGTGLDGSEALLLTSAILVLALCLQALAAWRAGYLLAPGVEGLRKYWAERGASSKWFLTGALIDSAALNLDTLVVGLLIAPEIAGVYFNAFRTAGLMTLFLFASALVIAPMISDGFHGGNKQNAQKILAVSAWTGFAFSLAMFLGFLMFGESVLSLFGEGNEAGYPVLIILSIGLLFDAATGPSRTTMMMTGHEKRYVQIFGTTTTISVVLQILVVPFFGIVGAALVNMTSRIVAQLLIGWWCRRHIGLDPTILAPLSMRREYAGGA